MYYVPKIYAVPHSCSLCFERWRSEVRDVLNKLCLTQKHAMFLYQLPHPFTWQKVEVKHDRIAKLQPGQYEVVKTLLAKTYSTLTN
jgi:hypothetical protein